MSAELYLKYLFFELASLLITLESMNKLLLIYAVSSFVS